MMIINHHRSTKVIIIARPTNYLSSRKDTFISFSSWLPDDQAVQPPVSQPLLWCHLTCTMLPKLNNMFTHSNVDKWEPKSSSQRQTWQDPRCEIELGRNDPFGMQIRRSDPGLWYLFIFNISYWRHATYFVNKYIPITNTHTAEYKKSSYKVWSAQATMWTSLHVSPSSTGLNTSDFILSQSSSFSFYFFSLNFLFPLLLYLALRIWPPSDQHQYLY